MLFNLSNLSEGLNHEIAERSDVLKFMSDVVFGKRIKMEPHVALLERRFAFPSPKQRIAIAAE